MGSILPNLGESNAGSLKQRLTSLDSIFSVRYEVKLDTTNGKVMAQRFKLTLSSITICCPTITIIVLSVHLRLYIYV